MKLIIAEKPSVAQSIAAALGIREKKEGYLEGLNAIVSWCIGHLVELAPANAYDERYAKWRAADLPILPHEWQYVVSESTKKQFHVLKALMNRPDVDSLVCATDAGREGELIFRLVYHQAGCQKPFKRLWISSMEESAIQEGFRQLRDGSEYDRLYQAALARQQADWLVGINASRFFSLLYDTTLNVGRVMSPTLSLIVQREKSIADFQPEQFYTVQLSCGFTASTQRMQDRGEAERIAEKCHLKTAVVQSIDKKQKTENAPKLYDLTALQRDANRLLGFTAQQTLDYAQSLYEKRLITYPRTDSKYLTSDMKEILYGLCVAIAGAFPYTAGISLTIHPKQVIDDEQVTDHHAIIPTASMPRVSIPTLPAGERDILQLIAVRLLCAVGDAHTYDETTVTVSCEGTLFSAKGKTVTHMGWKIPEATFRGSLGIRGRNEKEEAEYQMPDLKIGQELSPVMASVKEGKTTPPSHYTEDSLLAAMETAGADEAPEDAERKGLGTPATRANILEKLVSCGLIRRKGDKKTKYLLPTDKGAALIAVLPEQIQSPSMTAEWEQQLKEIEYGRMDARAFLDGICAMLQNLIQTEKPLPDAFQLFPSDRKTIGICPHCHAPVVIMEKGYFCRNKACHFSIWRDNRFFAKLGRKLTQDMAAELIRDGKTHLTGLYSKKRGNTYEAVVRLETDEAGNARYSLDFPQKNS